MGIAFTYNSGGIGSSGYLLAGVKLTADDLPSWTAPLPDAVRSIISHMAATTDSMRRVRLFAVIR